MATERMYELAFQYKGIKLWQQLYDDELFAVRLSDGAIGYCCDSTWVKRDIRATAPYGTRIRIA